MRPIHPFPARMAPEAVSKWLEDLPHGASVLDPMCGSGVVLRQSATLGHKARGFDLDPLAVLMSRVWTRKGQQGVIADYARKIISSAKRRKADHSSLPWVRRCDETRQFIEYWFAEPQRSDLARIVTSIIAISESTPQWIIDALYISLSRIIVTKHVGASLAWDISHSRPHKVRDENDYDVFDGYLRSAQRLEALLAHDPLPTSARVSRGDCRSLKSIEDHRFDAVVTSPPYLNAIDYLRGHKLSLVWMGHSIPQLRTLRSESVGTERAGGSIQRRPAKVPQLERSIRRVAKLPDRQRAIIHKYAEDANQMLIEMQRVVKPGGRVVLVLADSHLRGFPVPNSRIFSWLSEQLDWNLEKESTRSIPQNRRYLPIDSKSALSKRMKTEIVQVYSTPC